MNTFRKQRGMSMWGWLIVGTMSGIFIIAGLKLFPVYMEYYTMKGIIDQIKEDPELASATKETIQKSLSRRMGVEDLKNIDKDAYTVSKIQGRNAYTIDLYYEVRTPLFANLSIVAEFEYSDEVGE